MKIADLDDFTRHYLVAALWSSHDEDNNAAFDANYSLEDFAPEAIQKAHGECMRFQGRAADLLTQAYKLYQPHPDAPTPQASAGHDFWLTRNRHGVGYWDRGFGDFADLGNLGQRLTEIAVSFDECNLVVGGDGKIYIE